MLYEVITYRESDIAFIERLSLVGQHEEPAVVPDVHAVGIQRIEFDFMLIDMQNAAGQLIGDALPSYNFV